jgi:hypothetical protein
MKEDGACYTYGEQENCIQGVGCETLRKEATWKTSKNVTVFRCKDMEWSVMRSSGVIL